MADFVSSYGLIAAYVLIGLGVVLALVLPLISAISNPRSLLGAAAGLVLIAIVFFIGWSVASNEVTAVYIRNSLTSPEASKLVGGAIITMYILIVLALISIVFSEVSKIFR